LNLTNNDHVQTLSDQICLVMVMLAVPPDHALKVATRKAWENGQTMAKAKAWEDRVVNDQSLMLMDPVVAAVVMAMLTVRVAIDQPVQLIMITMAHTQRKSRTMHAL
jgi:hypothetical protein